MRTRRERLVIENLGTEPAKNVAVAVEAVGEGEAPQLHFEGRLRTFFRERPSVSSHGVDAYGCRLPVAREADMGRGREFVRRDPGGDAILEEWDCSYSDQVEPSPSSSLARGLHYFGTYLAPQ